MFVCLGVRRGLGRVLIKYSGNVRLQINFYIKIPFQEYEEPVYSYSMITTIYLEVGIHAKLLANRD